MSKRQRRGASVGNERHALFFFLVYLIGAILLTFEKWLFASLFSELQVIGGIAIILTAILLMSTYTVFVTVVPATKLRTDVAADNVYYLGFLYTLTSLAVALTINEPDAILSNFGVAIVSTLIGIAARVGLNQLRIDPNEIEEASRLELADATRKVRAELHETIRQMSDFRSVSLQVLTEGYEDVQKNIENIATKVLKSVEDLVEQSSKPLAELVADTKSANEEAVKSISSVTTSHEALATANKTMISQIATVNAALAELSEHYSSTGSIDEKVISSVQEQLLRVQSELTNKVTEEFSGLKTSVDDVSRHSQELKDELKLSFETKKGMSLKASRVGSADEDLSTTLFLGEKIKSYVNDKNAGCFQVGNKQFYTLEDAKSFISESFRKGLKITDNTE